MAKFGITAQIRAMDTIISVVANGDSLRKSERELLADKAKRIKQTLAFCEANVDEIREFITLRRRGK